MAKRIVPRQDETQEQPPITIETVVEGPMETVETVEIVPSQEIVALVDDSEDCYLFNEDTGELRLTRTRAGYAPAPMPFGFRLAKPSEIPGT